MKSLRAVALLSLCFAFSCKSRAPDSARAELIVGATLPLTGAEARIGGFYKEGYELAFEEVTKAGGLDVGGKKLPVKLILLDDTSTQATRALTLRAHPAQSVEYFFAVRHV